MFGGLLRISLLMQPPDDGPKKRRSGRSRHQILQRSLRHPCVHTRKGREALTVYQIVLSDGTKGFPSLRRRQEVYFCKCV